MAVRIPRLRSEAASETLNYEKVKARHYVGQTSSPSNGLKRTSGHCVHCGNEISFGVKHDRRRMRYYCVDATIQRMLTKSISRIFAQAENAIGRVEQPQLMSVARAVAAGAACKSFMPRETRAQAVFLNPTSTYRVALGEKCPKIHLMK